MGSVATSAADGPSPAVLLVARSACGHASAEFMVRTYNAATCSIVQGNTTGFDAADRGHRAHTAGLSRLSILGQPVRIGYRPAR
jgi:hypothetical protein